MSTRHLWPLLFLMPATPVGAIDPSFPKPPAARYKDRQVIECIREGTGDIERSLQALEKKANELRAAKESVAPVIVKYRRNQERWCEVEARCVVERVDSHKELVYGDTFEFCLGL